MESSYSGRMRSRPETSFLLLVALFSAPQAHAATARQSGKMTASMAAPQAAARDTAADKTGAADTENPNPVVVLQTSKGSIKIELFPHEAPKTVENFLRYVDSGFYTDTVFHRVIRGFVIQGGGFTPELELKPTLPPVPIETRNGLDNKRGSVAMARTLDRNSATSQFFINLSDNGQLNRSAHSFGYTVFGRVIEGMEVVDRIAAVQTSRRGEMDDVPIIPVFLESAHQAKH
jgi:peptidyl-prolyl cis-trans isomerase A (cyclophilin A)